MSSMADEECVPFVEDPRLYKFVTLIVFVVSLLTFILIHFFCPPKYKRSGYIVKNLPTQNKHKESKLTSMLTSIDHQLSNSTSNLITPNSDYTMLVTEEDVRIPIPEKQPTEHRYTYPDRNTKPALRDRPNKVQENNSITAKNASCDFVYIGKPENPFSTSLRSVGQLANSPHPHPKLKRCTSSQELLTHKPSQSVLTSFSSMPNVNAEESSDVYPLMQLASQCNYDGSLAGSKDSDKENDNEGSMRCAISYERHRHLHMSGLAIQTTLPPESPGFVVEFSLIPKDVEDNVRSKVYMTHDKRRVVDISLNESFKLSCSDNDIEKCSIVITVKPLLGNIIFYAESELRGLDLMLNAEVYLAGYLKGVRTYTLAYND